MKSEHFHLQRLYIITPTHERPTQKADLTRLAQTLMHVSNVHWVVVEDADTTHDLVRRLLNRCMSELWRSALNYSRNVIFELVS